MTQINFSGSKTDTCGLNMALSYKVSISPNHFYGKGSPWSHAIRGRLFS